MNFIFLCLWSCKRAYAKKILKFPENGHFQLQWRLLKFSRSNLQAMIILLISLPITYQCRCQRYGQIPKKVWMDQSKRDPEMRSFLGVRWRPSGRASLQVLLLWLQEKEVGLLHFVVSDYLVFNNFHSPIGSHGNLAL